MALLSEASTRVSAMRTDLLAHSGSTTAAASASIPLQDTTVRIVRASTIHRSSVSMHAIRKSSPGVAARTTMLRTSARGAKDGAR